VAWRGPAARVAWLFVLAAALAPACRRSPESAPAASPSAAAPADLRTRVLLSGPWRFQGSQDLAGAEAPAFDDRHWSAVTVPHTWGAEPFQSAWYRLRLPIAKTAPTQRVPARLASAGSQSASSATARFTPFDSWPGTRTCT